VHQLDETVGELARPREHRQVAAGNLVDFEPQALAGDTALELDGEEPVLGRREHTRRQVRPPLEGSRLAEHAVTGGALVALVVARDVRIDVVEEDLGDRVRAP
jgi:hypothetical protein